jgi:2Fe-2S ferredoxin
MAYQKKAFGRLLFACSFAGLLKSPSTFMYTIHFKFEEKGLEPVTIEQCAVDDSILEVALKNNLRIHHNCGGVCACSTCHIYLESNASAVEELSDKEEDFIDRARNPRLNSRLSCQCILLEGNGTIEVTIPDQTLIHGE